MRPWVPEAPPRPPRHRRSRVTGSVGASRGGAAPAADVTAAAGAAVHDDVGLRRRIAERRAFEADGEERALPAVIAEALAAQEEEARTAAVRRRSWWWPGGAQPPVPEPAPVPPAVRAVRSRALEDELAGFGPLSPWVRREGVTDVLVDGAGNVWTDGAEGLVPRPLRLDPDAARALAVRLLGQAGRRLDASVPLADARVGGVRVHAVLPPVSGGGTTLSLRVPAPRARSLAELAESWPDGATWCDAARRLVQDHATVLVSGATGTGKTTLLSAALSAVPPDQRIITVEDTLEAAPDHPHVVALQCRAANEEGAGEVTLPELIRTALRMRPDRLVVGECRGAEVTDFLTALNTGHQGAWGTLHANSAADVPARLAAMAALAGWGPAAVDAQARAGVDAVLHVVRDRHGRHPVQLSAPDPDAAGFCLVPALTWEDDGGPEGCTVQGPGLPLLRERLVGRSGP